MTVTHLRDYQSWPTSMLTNAFHQTSILSSHPFFNPFRDFIMRTPTSFLPINSDVYTVARHTSGMTIGPMPVQKFLDTFLPNAPVSKSKAKRGVCSRIPAKRVNNTLVSRVYIDTHRTLTYSYLFDRSRR